MEPSELSWWCQGENLQDVPSFVVESFRLAQDSIKQMMTLSTAVLAVSVSFSKEIAKVEGRIKLLLFMGWVVLLSSGVAGFLATQSVTGNLSLLCAPGEDGPGSDLSIPSGLSPIYAHNITVFVGIQVALLSFGMLFLIAHAIAASLVEPPKS